ncbi:MAG: electron transport complex subunit RsxG [Colwellia sp.]|nr:electron transport complex subunit RsxG [Colwellia sp.]
MSVAISKNSKILALFAISCTAIVGLVNELTKDRIYHQQQKQLLSTLNNIIEAKRYNNELTLDCVKVNSLALGSDKQQTVYLARLNSTPVAAAITAVAPNGYNGNIELIVAMNVDGSINGVRILNHQETPGLGDKIDLAKSNWITSFSGKSLMSQNDSRWAVAKDGGMFDQFTGATITPRAVVAAVKKTALYFKENQNSLFSQKNDCQLTNEVLMSDNEEKTRDDNEN